jgi:hypothetical protein
MNETGMTAQRRKQSNRMEVRVDQAVETQPHAGYPRRMLLV